ncbi:ankyrin repeat-containing domain protein [Russula vinacea]|nr:ankyrin repeat-containing domain protein [Russula vinacea]
MGSPLVAALRGKHFKVAELLHRNGADVDVRDRQEDTPLCEACRYGVSDVAQWLLNHGADANAQGCWNGSPLRLAAYLGHLKEDPIAISVEGGNDNNATWLKEHGATR